MHTNCEKHQCVCANNYSQKNGKCVGNLGASCSSSADCDTEKNSKCVDNKCVCIENYFLSDGRCKQGLNTHCSRDDDCSAVMNARCIKETCNCMAHNVQVSTERCMPGLFVTNLHRHPKSMQLRKLMKVFSFGYSFFFQRRM